VSLEVAKAVARPRSMALVVLRGALLVLAYVHTIPARTHLARFFAEPSLGEAWKGFGAVLAIGLYLLPIDFYAKAFGYLWAKRRVGLVAAGWVLALAHAAPAIDHVPRFFEAPSFADAWRGFGAAFACLWFVAPLRVQAAVVGALRALATTTSTSDRSATRRRRIAMSLALGLLLGGLVGFGTAGARAHYVRVKPAPAPGPSLVVPLASGPITIDGELEDEGWTGVVARTGAFHSDEGGDGKPYSDARFVTRDGNLYVILYAADEDIRATTAKHDEPLYLADAFQLVFHTADGERVLDVSPRGVVTDGSRAPNGAVDFRWESNAKVAVDTDGLVNDSSDMDEEWVIEMAIPLSSLGLHGIAGESVGLSIRRCDDVKSIGRLCSGWGADPNARGTLVFAGTSSPPP
jgi:hypothetical protein